jgi:hypothetical protein
MSKPTLDPRCAPRIAGHDLVQLYNLAIDKSQTPEARGLAKSHLLGYSSRGPDQPFAQYLLNLLAWYETNPTESPVALTHIPRFTPPARKREPERDTGGNSLWDF